MCSKFGKIRFLGLIYSMVGKQEKVNTTQGGYWQIFI